MTNVQTNLEYAIKALEAGRLTSAEADFIESIRDYSKKDLGNLSSKDFKELRRISDK